MATSSQDKRRVAVLGGNRIPFARSDGAYAEASNQDMFTAALLGLVDRFGLQGERLGAIVQAEIDLDGDAATPPVKVVPSGSIASRSLR